MSTATIRMRGDKNLLTKVHDRRCPAIEEPNPTNNETPCSDSSSHPEKRYQPISQDQLINEVKGIYAGLVMVECKCIEVDNALSSSTVGDADFKLNNEQWLALIALHRTLLHEHHDFFLASQHPSASPALQRLVTKYAMPARMWRHGIHSFLEVLRHKTPASSEHMLSFIYLAYGMMALLYETVPALEDTWIECLGDLGRYRMAIEDGDIRDREVWTCVSRRWYSKASHKPDKVNTTGRLYHHLAILARPDALKQLYYYTRSPCRHVPYMSSRETIMTLFDPMDRPMTHWPGLDPTMDELIPSGKLHHPLTVPSCPDSLRPPLSPTWAEEPTTQRVCHGVNPSMTFSEALQLATSISTISPCILDDMQQLYLLLAHLEIAFLGHWPPIGQQMLPPYLWQFRFAIVEQYYYAHYVDSGIEQLRDGMFLSSRLGRHEGIDLRAHWDECLSVVLQGAIPILVSYIWKALAHSLNHIMSIVTYAVAEDYPWARGIRPPAPLPRTLP